MSWEYQQNYQPEQSDPLKLPAIFLIIAESIAMIVGIGHGILQIINIGSGAIEMQIRHGAARNMAGVAYGAAYGSIVLDAIAIIIAPIVIFGAIKMLKRQNYGFARFAAILSIVPIVGCCCCILPQGFGIWALIVLNKPEVKGQFAS